LERSLWRRELMIKNWISGGRREGRSLNPGINC
jgi:hypothetical protein